MGRHRRGLWFLDEPARGHLPPAARHPRRLGDRGQRAGDGIRQYGAGLRDRRRLHPRPVDRRQRVLRRVPGKCAGRGCRGRDPHPAASDDRRQGGEQLGFAGDGRGHARGVDRTPQGAPDARRPLPRHAGHRVHRSARQVVDAADAHRQAHRAGRAEDRGLAGRGGGDRPGGGDPPDRTRVARPAAAPDARSHRRRRRFSPADCRRRPAPPRARSCFPPTRPNRSPRAAKR